MNTLRMGLGQDYGPNWLCKNCHVHALLACLDQVGPRILDLRNGLGRTAVDFFTQVNLLYGTLTNFCTPENCPTMTAGPKYIEGQLDDESIFPQKIGNKCLILCSDILPGCAPFPLNFREVVKTIFKRLFHVYAHIYHSHFQKIVSLKEEAHLNTCFKHFILFTCSYQKEEVQAQVRTVVVHEQVIQTGESAY
ncbi:hypothetical protein CsSME_00016029 [Camellia sinensis var. sinensis]